MARSSPFRPARAASQRGEVSYSVDPKDQTFSNGEPTGDVVLFADAGTPVCFRWERQKRVTSQPLVLKGYLPQMLKVTAEAATGGSGGSRAESWVPVRTNCITTVRFRLR